MGGGAALIERNDELVAVDDAFAEAVAGRGGIVVVEGHAGIGKSALVAEARRRAAHRHMTVVSAQGSVLERDFGFGIVRQLFEPVVRTGRGADGGGLLVGAAGLARPVLVGGASSGDAGDQGAVLHGLYWLTANLAEARSVLVVVDDVHWCDAPSLRYLAYLARRLEALPVAVIVAVRTGEVPVDGAALAQVCSAGAARTVRPAPLSVTGVGALVAEGLGATASVAFAAACHEATGGMPFLVKELVVALRAGGVGPTTEAAERIAAAGPHTVAQAVMLRLARLGPSAAEAARAVAVLGRSARVNRLARLARLDPDEAVAALDALAAIDVLVMGPLGFTHPLVRQAVYDDIPPATRADTHRRAGEILAAEGAPAEEVATQLLASDPAGSNVVVEHLRVAAAHALAHRAPQSAVAYLRRALAESALGPDRAGLVRELAEAEAFTRDPAAADHLHEAMELTDDPVAKAEIAYRLSVLWMLSGQPPRAQSMSREALAHLGDRDLDLAARIEAALAVTDAHDPRTAPDLDRRLPRLRTLTDPTGPGARALGLVLAAILSFRGQIDHAEIVALTAQALDGGQLLAVEGSESLLIPQALSALLGIDDADAAERATDGVFDDAVRRGSVAGFVAASYYRTAIDTHRGVLHSAEAHLRSTIETALEHGMTFALPSTFLVGADALLERTSLSDIAALVEGTELPPDFAATTSGAWVLSTRGRLRASRGDRRGAVVDLSAAGRIIEAVRFSNPILAPWRCPLALALLPEDRDEARALVEKERQFGEETGLARCEGVALRAAAGLEGGVRAVELLERSVELLERPDATLEQARSFVELGAALRRQDHRASAREPLGRGLDLAHRCGADRLEERAIAELRLSGVRPRRHALSGVEALTAGEARVARLAADGLSNRDIAQRLFVTTKTVENQLSAAYRKLQLTSRDQLPDALH